MPHQIELSDPTFHRLQNLAIPLVDEPENVVKRLLDLWDSEHTSRAGLTEPYKAAQAYATAKAVPNVSMTTSGTPRSFDPVAAPSLTHTKLLSAKIAGSSMLRPTWNGLMFHMIGIIPRQRLANIDDARRLVIVNFVTGMKDEEGYKPVPGLGISVQGQDANNAWKAACHIAKQLGISIEVEFLWRMKDEAAFPGTTGRFSV